ncbi:Druantia anti-phage system protein DruA [Notoacmeibacter marinus]|uniref:Druantia anti-phage system protein DruA n=1 Tax=Notoacmeibacter marinus TaxID=1876515 RepID=UPI001FDFFFE6|nr:Druantia anti-phage system protein DruA [Notoacmeibacter marinus]
MAENEELFGPGRQRAFSPYLAPGERKTLRSVMDFAGQPIPSFADELRSLARRFIDDGDSLKLRTICLLVADLFEQGWRVAFEPNRMLFEPPGIARDGNQSIDDIKARVRQALQVARYRQLQEPSVRNFLTRTERRRPRVGKTASIIDLIDDGAELAKEFRRINDLPDTERADQLARLVDPEIEFCEAGARCRDTGLPLNDIWRYFRHTWAHEYRPIPGRQMLVLIRNRARTNRPVMGIAMLASPVMRLSTRDNWIGWLREAAEERIETGEWQAREFARAMRLRIEQSISAIRWDDLATGAEIRSPTEAVALRLEQRAAGAAAARETELKAHYEASLRDHDVARPHRGALKTASADADWRSASEDLLFVRKRAEMLAKLLFAKQVFRDAGLGRSPAKALPSLLTSRDGKRAIDIALAEFRKAGLSSQIADVSICGAVHPYNELLGGKLVALMLTTQELRDAYSRRYGDQISVIASQMAGRPITKPADLKLLTTTSLYGVGSSQYNRLTLRASDYPDIGNDLRWRTIGKSLTGGFGTIHLGSETAQALRNLAFSRHDARRVNNRFGEGTSPRLRQIREGLDALGLKSDAILHHATPRIFYGCELLPDARASLLGLHAGEQEAPSAKAVGAAWRSRWVDGRIRRPETLEGLCRLGPSSIHASLHADEFGQLSLPIEGS